MAESRTELLDSLLHSNKKRVLVGALCGVAAGFVLLLISMLFTPPGSGKLWWIQILATPFFDGTFMVWLKADSFFGGSALAYDAGPSVFIAGFAFFLFLSLLCGAIVGKMTTNSEVPRMAFYGFVFGFLCWLASNMFGPNFLNYAALQNVGQVTRLAMFMSFGVSLGVFLALASRILKV
ncbi:MAG: hypothetical protein SGI74_14455 [Oligoflexia bacterium]|nr:hypothetical protein [Oligoflexia bacterium]